MNLLTATRATVKQIPGEAEDRELTARLARGEEQALEQVIERYGQRVTALAARLLGWSDGAEDVAQEVFLTVLRKGHEFRGQARLWTWLAAITVNRCRSVRRRQWLSGRVLRAIGPARQEQPPACEPPTEQEERAAAIRTAVANLPATHREAIVLRYFEELSLDEMAEALSLRRNTVEVRLARARRRLARSLGPWMDA